MTSLVQTQCAPFAGLQPTCASVELIWIAAKNKKYTFNYDIAKEINGGKQMRNLWEIKAERHITKHPTEKPETLLDRIIRIGSNVGDVVMDPFMVQEQRRCRSNIRAFFSWF